MTQLRLQSLRDRLVLVTPVRLALGVVWVVAAWLAGAPGHVALLAGTVGCFGTAAALAGDPRTRIARRREPVDAPPGARTDSLLRQTVTAMLPSTAVVSVLAAASLVPQPTLTALLGGASAGMALAGLASLPDLHARERAAGGRLYVDRRGRELYVLRAGTVPPG